MDGKRRVTTYIEQHLKATTTSCRTNNVTEFPCLSRLSACFPRHRITLNLEERRIPGNQAQIDLFIVGRIFIKYFRMMWKEKGEIDAGGALLPLASQGY